MKVLIVYYSTYGHVYRMATHVAEGVKEIPGAEPVVRTVPELIPKSVIDSRDDMRAGRAMQQGVPLVTLDDFREAGAYAFGTPTRFGNVSAQLKNQIDQLTSLWLNGELEGKAAGIFVSTSSLHGGQETTILSLMAPMLHLGMILVGVPYSVQELFTTQGGGACDPRSVQAPPRAAVHHTVRATLRAPITSVRSTNRRRRSAALSAAVWR
jgi:NAD(P)H dehydrogenase (quinone)